MMKKFLAIAALAVGFLGFADVNAAVVSGVETATPAAPAALLNAFLALKSSPAIIKNMSGHPIECKTSAGSYMIKAGFSVVTEIRVTNHKDGEQITLLSRRDSIQTNIKIKPKFKYELKVPSYPDLKDCTLTVYD
jgi:hypothetical protein